jgi:hypothetical protein
MKVLVRETAIQDSLVSLIEINGKFELSKQQILRGNIVDVQVGNKNFSIKL